MTQDPLIGQKLGAYQVQSKLGEGGMASVYKGYHDRLHRDVAIKVISAQIADQMDFQLRFEREAQLIASLEHRNIVAVYDFGEQQELTYLVMQFVGGGTLRDRMLSGRPLDPGRAAQCTLQMARALHHAHQRGIVHRDVKPQNMLISSTDPNHLLLSDFGIAKLFDSVEETVITNTPVAFPSNPQLTSADQMIGTADYMAPEQINRLPVDARTDVYALGVVLYQMLTGYTPFHSTTIMGLLYQQVHTPPRPIREVNPSAPEILAQIASKALEKAPEARFQSAEEMASALEHALNLATHPLSNTQNSISGATTFPSSGTPSFFSSATAYTAPPIQMQTSQTPPAGQSLAHYTSLPITNASGKIRPKKRFSLTNFITLLFLLVALVFFGIRVLPGLLSAAHSSTGSPIQLVTNVDSFDERFQNNRLGWLEGTDTTGHLTTTLGNQRYTLKTDNAAATFFPYPQHVNSLPASFTITARITQTEGAPNHYYGVSFYFKNENQTETGYAFLITSAGKYVLLKYSGLPRSTNLGPYSIYQDIRGLGKENTLVISAVKGQITCSVNGDPAGRIQIPTDPMFQGGIVSLLVTGPNASYVVSELKLEDH